MNRVQNSAKLGLRDSSGAPKLGSRAAGVQTLKFRRPPLASQWSGSPFAPLLVSVAGPSSSDY